MKKTLSKFFATAAAVSMLASVATVVNADEATVEFTTKAVEGGVVVTGVTGADDATEITIPEKIGEADVIGVADYSFVGIENLAVINAPASLKKDFIGNVAFMTNRSIKCFINSEIGKDATEDDVVLYIATKLSYNGKTTDWTADELKEVKDKVQAKATLAGVPDGTSYEDAAIIMLQNKDKMQLSADTTDKLVVVEATVPYRDVKVNAPEGSDAATIWKEKKVTLTGDANADGTVNVRDCAFIASALAKKQNDQLPAQSDYNEDGKINVRDAAALAHDLASKKN